ncbi:Serine/threonine-protein kinase pkn3 [Cystobacter fuscus DSM 2262]|uniref:non-specific serine/threonine protein kinase n=1 Tax=Cystobacter fuscus (strain ATCC 25194 / DSM 2262 / NBRC 100088 / M29) TaxID=1242864 RepID=S9P8R0_CYSF2|nr:serine/threonine-protein kinase [Cystobacter fuscus]EPX58617.1 Serine/threonine-protein kinase pkn3 [Cystobacter fuscus DSM 2262]
MLPKVIGGYRVLETLGSGGVGTVYRALDGQTSEPVALKVLSGAPTRDSRAARRLLREFETLTDLSHPNVVKVYDTGMFQSSPYLVMELIEGLTLRDYLALKSEASRVSPVRAKASLERSEDESGEDGSEPSGVLKFDLSAFAEESPSEECGVMRSGSTEAPGRMSRAPVEPWLDSDSDDLDPLDFEPPEDRTRPHAPPETRESVLRLEELNRPERMGRLKDSLLQVCEALAYIHAHGLVHRDLKPSNIMVDEDRQVRLMDFGLAKFLADDAGMTLDGRMVGTLRYMAPEQILDEPLDGRTDLYSLGVVLYELLTGRPPFDAKSPVDLWHKVLETEPPPLLALNPRADPQLARVAHRLLRKEPDDRFQTAEEVYEALSE